MALDILVVDDEQDIRDLVSGILSDEGFETRAVESRIEAIQAIQQKSPNLVILDVWLGESERDGLNLLEMINADYEYIPVIMMSGHGTIETAVAAIKHGAYDFIEKPFDSNRLLTSVEKALESTNLKKENAELKIKAKVSENILGQSQGILALNQMIEKTAPLSGRCVIIGPTGSDKEIVAKEIHRLSPRSSNSFCAINCLSFSANQLETELFGVCINSQFGSPKIKHGIFEKAAGGTLFIDELVAVPCELQNKILRVLKDGFFSRIGASEKIYFDARIIAGFPPNIESLIKQEAFSDELFCRLNANLLKIPALHSRREDINILLDFYMEKSAKAQNVQKKKFSNKALGILNSYSWPGDVAQLRNLVDWTLSLNSSQEAGANLIDVDDLPKDIIGGVDVSKETGIGYISRFSGLSIKEAREEFERQYFIEQLKKFSGNISQTSEFVGMERSALHRKLKALNIHNSKSYKFNNDE